MRDEDYIGSVVDEIRSEMRGNVVHPPEGNTPPTNKHGVELPVAIPTVIPDDLLATYEWVIDQFIYNGTFCIAGTHGVGKTSSILPLAMVAAGAVEFPGITATLKRDVVYVEIGRAHV